MDQETLRQELLSHVLPLVGGQANIARRGFHSGTLYVTLKDQGLADLDGLRGLSGVTGADLSRGKLKLALTEKYFEEEKQMADNKKIASDILAAVGGKENVTQATHCMTRLRLNLNDTSIPNEEEVKKIPGILGVVQAGGQFQIIIGQNVPKVYAEFCNLTGLAVQEAIQENLDGPKEKLTPKKIGGNIMNYIAGSMTPMIPAMMAAGLCKALTAVLGPNMLKVIAETDNLYILLNFMYDGFFYFLPIMIGFNAAKKLNIPAPLGAYMGGVLLAPAFMEIVAAGTPFDIFGINVTLVDYSQSVVPVLLSVAFMGLVYRLLAKVMPDTVTTIFTPFFTVLISVPVSLVALAPLGNIISKAIGGGLAAFGNATGFLGVAVIAAIWQFLVMTGMHVPVIMTFMVDFMEKGYQTGAILGAVVAQWACWAVGVGAFLRLKNKQEKSSALGFAISGFLGGVTEPTMYGLCMKYKRCWLGIIIGGFVGGAYLGLTHVCSYVMGGATNFLMLINYTGGTTANLVNGIIGNLLGFIVSAVVVYFFGFSKDEIKE